MINFQQTENVDDDDDYNDIDEEEQQQRKPSLGIPSETIIKSVTNESISEIADKLAEADIDLNQQSTPVTTNPVVPGSVVKVLENNSTGGYSSSGEISKDTAYKDDIRRKKFRKHTASFSGEQQADEVLTSSGEYHTEDKKSQRQRKRNTKTKDSTTSEKLIEIETPPQTPHHETKPEKEPTPPPNQVSKSRLPTKTIAIPGFKPLNKLPEKTVPSEKTSGTAAAAQQKKRKRTRHKVYLDDPDVHQLITDHVSMLHKYLEDVAAGRTPKRELQSIGKYFWC